MYVRLAGLHTLRMWTHSNFSKLQFAFDNFSFYFEMCIVLKNTPKHSAIHVITVFIQFYITDTKPYFA